MSSAALVYSLDGRATRRDESELATAFLDGLRKQPKELPCKFFYDAEGSALFDRICDLPEYYPTRTEMRLLRDRAGEIAAMMGSNIELVEFGAGSLQKVGILLDALDEPLAYVPIDISGDYLRQMAAELLGAYAGRTGSAVVADFTMPLRLPVLGARRVGFFPGSTIGNLNRAEALAFCWRAAAMC